MLGRDYEGLASYVYALVFDISDYDTPAEMREPATTVVDY